jgi:hypothetical protein
MISESLVLPVVLGLIKADTNSSDQRQINPGSNSHKVLSLSQLLLYQYQVDIPVENSKRSL